MVGADGTVLEPLPMMMHAPTVAPAGTPEIEQEYAPPDEAPLQGVPFTNCGSSMTVCASAGRGTGKANKAATKISLGSHR
jgi:hypothetical protein